MATKAVLTAIALCLCVQFSFADEFRWITEEEEPIYTPMCPNRNGTVSAPMPPDNCDLEKYIGCRNGKAETIIDCPEGKFFNRTTRWCEAANNFTRPAGCGPAPTKKPYPLDCKDVTELPDKVPVSFTCKKYVQCSQTGNHLMFCQIPFFYLPTKKRCIPTTWPYSSEMSDEFIAKCNQLDPYLPGEA